MTNFQIKNMQKSKHFAKYVVLIIAGIAILSFVVMQLWNWILPEAAGWNTITFWQAMGLLVLSKILFSGWGRGGSKWKQYRWKSKMKEKWDNMSDEEKSKFKDMMGPCVPKDQALRTE